MNKTREPGGCGRLLTRCRDGDLSQQPPIGVMQITLQPGSPFEQFVIVYTLMLRRK